MDLLGFKKQLVFATHSVVTPFHPSSSYAAPSSSTAGPEPTTATWPNSAPTTTGSWVSASWPSTIPASAIAELEWAIDAGLEAMWVPHRAPIDMAPGHVDLEPFWARLAEAGDPVRDPRGRRSPLHTSEVVEQQRPRPRPVTGWVEARTSARRTPCSCTKMPEAFISMLVADGVFARHPDLRGAAVELGAGWVPELLRRVDSVARIFSRVDESMRFDRKPSEQLTQQMGFTPFPHEDVARLIADSNEDLYLFSSDYPHIEGGRDPIGKFEGHMAPTTDEAKTKFFSENFLRIWPEARVAA